MKTKVYNPGDKVSFQTKTREWRGRVLESHDPEIILLKLDSGYNIEFEKVKSLMQNF